jgi:Asp-tRNA(Asn)/Glu-tRNA(Gln) amidotransferase A subunit family amidase
LRKRADDFEPLSVDRFLAGALQPAAWYTRAQRFRRMYREQVNALFGQWDVLLAPATPMPAPVLGTEILEINGRQYPCRPSIGLLTQPVSFAGCPLACRLSPHRGVKTWRCVRLRCWRLPGLRTPSP